MYSFPLKLILMQQARGSEETKLSVASFSKVWRGCVNIHSKTGKLLKTVIILQVGFRKRDEIIKLILKEALKI